MEICHTLFCDQKQFDGCTDCKASYCEKHFYKAFVQKNGSVKCPLCEKTIQITATKSKICIATTHRGLRCTKPSKTGIYCYEHSPYDLKSRLKSDIRIPIKCRVCKLDIEGKGTIQRTVKGTAGLAGGSITGALVGTIIAPGFGTLFGMAAGGILGGLEGGGQRDDVCVNCCGRCERMVCICSQIVGVCVECRSTKVKFSDNGVCPSCKNRHDV